MIFCSPKDSRKHNLKDHHESEQQHNEQILNTIYLHYNLDLKKKSRPSIMTPR